MLGFYGDYLLMLGSGFGLGSGSRLGKEIGLGLGSGSGCGTFFRDWMFKANGLVRTLRCGVIKLEAKVLTRWGIN